MSQGLHDWIVSLVIDAPVVDGDVRLPPDQRQHVRVDVALPRRQTRDNVVLESEPVLGFSSVANLINMTTRFPDIARLSNWYYEPLQCCIICYWKELRQSKYPNPELEVREMPRGPAVPAHPSPVGALLEPEVQGLALHSDPHCVIHHWVWNERFADTVLWNRVRYPLELLSSIDLFGDY